MFLSHEIDIKLCQNCAKILFLKLRIKIVDLNLFEINNFSFLIDIIENSIQTSVSSEYQIELFWASIYSYNDYVSIHLTFYFPILLLITCSQNIIVKVHFIL